MYRAYGIVTLYEWSFWSCSTLVERVYQHITGCTHIFLIPFQFSSGPQSNNIFQFQHCTENSFSKAIRRLCLTSQRQISCSRRGPGVESLDYKSPSIASSL